MVKNITGRILELYEIQDDLFKFVYKYMIISKKSFVIFYINFKNCLPVFFREYNTI